MIVAKIGDHELLLEDQDHAEKLMRIFQRAKSLESIYSSTRDGHVYAQRELCTKLEVKILEEENLVSPEEMAALKDERKLRVGDVPRLA